MPPDGTRRSRTLITRRSPPRLARGAAWREVVVRAGGERTEMQAVGRDVTARVDAEPGSVRCPHRADAANRAKHVSWR